MPIYKNNPRSRARVSIDKHKVKDTKIVIGENVVSRKRKPIKYLCNKCDGPLNKISDDEWHCDQCRITTIPSVEDVRTAQDIEVPQGPAQETLVSTVPTGYENIKIHREPELKGSFKALRDKGIRITNYKEENPK